jgi:hypothetical protein
VASSLLAPRWGAIAHLIDVLGIGLLAASGAVITYALVSRTFGEVTERKKPTQQPERASAATLEQTSERLLSALEDLTNALGPVARELDSSSRRLEQASATLGHLADRRGVEEGSATAAILPKLDDTLREACEQISRAAHLLERSLGQVQQQAERVERGYDALASRASAQDSRIAESAHEIQRSIESSLASLAETVAKLTEAGRVREAGGQRVSALPVRTALAKVRGARRVTGRAGRIIPVDRTHGGAREASPREEVDCGVFAPPSAAAGDSFLVQVFAYAPEHAAEVQAMAVEFDETAKPRAFATLETSVAQGSRLMFHLLLPGLVIDDPVRDVTWRGRPVPLQFGVSVPRGCPPCTTIGTVVVSQDSVPIGHVKFRLEVVVSTTAASQPPEPAGEEAKLYRLAFVSYAREDEEEVTRRVQMLQAVGIQYFLDAIQLSPGDRWEREIYRHIDECDLFLLFWSRAASQSEWVLKETRYALQRKSGDDLAPPEIRPVIIEGPPVPPPPPDLAHLHFDDPLLYFIGA